MAGDHMSAGGSSSCAGEGTLRGVCVRDANELLRLCARRQATEDALQVRARSRQDSHLLGSRSSGPLSDRRAHTVVCRTHARLALAGFLFLSQTLWCLQVLAAMERRGLAPNAETFGELQNVFTYFPKPM